MESKNLFDLTNGDIIRVEYGDYDNWVTAVFESFTIDDRCVRIKWHRLGKNESEEMCALHSDSRIYKFIGTEKDYI